MFDWYKMFSDLERKNELDEFLNNFNSINHPKTKKENNNQKSKSNTFLNDKKYITEKYKLKDNFLGNEK